METVRESMIVAPPPPRPLPTSLAPGFRFHPTDEELVRYYLRRKVCGKPFQFQVVSEVDVYKSEPWELADYTSLISKDLEWYFFSPIDKKYASSSRVNRATVCGHWKETGKIRYIDHNSERIGQKKTLIFHSGRAPHGKRTNWVMHEYKLLDQELQTAGVAQDSFVLCRIFQKSGLGPPVGDHLAPFFDEEWDDEAPLIVSGGDANNDVADDNETHAERNNTTQMDSQTIPIPVASKRVRSENGGLNSEPELETLTLFRKNVSKGSDPNSSNANGSQDSTMTSQGLITTNLSSALITAKETHPPTNPLSFDVSALEKSVPPGYLELLRDMENKIRDVSIEKDTLKTELMQAKATINDLHSHIDQLSKEITELRRGV